MIKDKDHFYTPGKLLYKILISLGVACHFRKEIYKYVYII